jgi:hypothetical protein
VEKISEIVMQAIIMNWAMNEKQHLYVVPNSTVIYPWESDLISVTKALYSHEYEIKISRSDYRKDAEKKWKHMSLQLGDIRNTPNYFWYATYGFDIEPPAHAGWIQITPGAKRHNLTVMKEAPRLCEKKMSDQQQHSLARLLSFRITDYYRRYLNDADDDGRFITAALARIDNENA